MRYMLDTNILIYLIKHKSIEIINHINKLNDNDTLSMSFISYAELLKGAEGSIKKEQVLKQIKALTQTIPVEYETNQKLCSNYAQHSMKLKKAGNQIGANDLWIACHALSLDAVLVTNNEREFIRVDGLKLENWLNS